jgi:hypothetical protein
MPDCDYCEASFADEEEYLTHLETEHRGELGAIDRRRIEDREDEQQGLPTGPLVLGLILVIASIAVAYTVLAGGGGDGTDASGIESEPLPENGDPALLEDVEQHPSEGTEHVDRGTDVSYETTPPTSGPHYSSATSAGFYSEPQPEGELVHALEHGAVVIYYDEDALSEEAEQSLREWASAHTGTWQSVIVVPNPYDEVDSPYVLTAWRHSLRMTGYDAEVVRAFLAEYLGRGPENPVR